MHDIFHRSRVDSEVTFKKNIEDILQAENNNFPVMVPYGMQHEYTITVATPIRCSLHTIMSQTHNYVVHHGVGKNNRLSIWSRTTTTDRRPRKVRVGNKTEYAISNFIYLAPHFVYVASCTDLRLRVLGNLLQEYSSLELQDTVLDMLNCEHLDVFITSGPGFVHLYKLGVCLQQPPVLLKALKLPLLLDEIPWICQMSFNAKTSEILSVCQQGIFFLAAESVDDFGCKDVLENRHATSLNCAVAYPVLNYVITGKLHFYSICL